MRLLWLTPEVPEPGGTGGAIRAHRLLSVLAREGFEVTVVAPSYADQRERAEAARPDGMELRLPARPASQAREAAGAIAGSPSLALRLLTDPWLGWQAGVFWTEIRAAVRAAEAETGPRLAVVEHDFAAPWARHLAPGLPVGLMTQNAKWATSSAEYGPLTAARFRAFVKRNAGRFSMAWAVSEADRAAVASLRPGLEVGLVPNGADTTEMGAVAPGGATADRLLFTGTLSYPPNAEAVMWFATEVLPLVRERRPAVTLEVVGRGAPPEVQALDGRDGISLAGFVESLVPSMQAAQVVVAPLRSGGGTKLKVLEAMAAARAVVATPVGAEGIDAADGEHLLVRDDPRAFADAVLALLGDPGRATALGEAGRALAKQRYDWDEIGLGLRDSMLAWAERSDAAAGQLDVGGQPVEQRDA